MQTPRETTPTAAAPTSDAARTDQHAPQGTEHGAPTVRTVVVGSDGPIERTVETHTVDPQPPVIRTVVTEGTGEAVRDAREQSARPDRTAWWIGGGTLTAGSLAAAVTAAVKKARRPQPATVLERVAPALRNPGALGTGLAALTATATAAGLARSARRGRREEQDAYGVEHEETAVLAVVPAYTELDEDETAGLFEEEAYAGEVLDEQSMPTVPLPVEARVLLETLLDPALAEGRDLPGAAELRAQLPHVSTVADGAEDEMPGVDWMPLVVDPEVGLDRAVPHDFTWPVRGRFTVEDHPFALVLVVIDGELGALAVSPDDAEGMDWDTLPELQAWPGVEELSFEVDGERR